MDKTITTVRSINFPVELIWHAWTDPNILCQWWGPKGFTNTFHEFDFREEGKWIYTMHGPDAGNYENDAWFTRIETGKKIEWNRNSQPRFYTIVEFEQLNDSQTKITWKMTFETEDMFNKVVKFAKDKNEENLDRLEEQLRLITLVN